MNFGFEMARRTTSDAQEAKRWVSNGVNVRPLYASPEAALRAAVPRELEGWRAGMEAAAKIAETEHTKITWDHDHQVAERYGAAVAAKIRALPAPPTAAPSKETGEGEAAIMRDVTPDEHRMLMGAMLRSAEHVGDGSAPTAAAPAPGREDESDAAWLKKCIDRLDEICTTFLHARKEPVTARKLENWSADVSGIARALGSLWLARREPTRLEGGVTQEQVEADDKECRS